MKRLRIGTLLCCALAGSLLSTAESQAVRVGSADVKAIAHPHPKGTLIDTGHHWKIRIAREGAPTKLALPVRRERLLAVDRTTLHVASFDERRKRYRLVGPAKVRRGEIAFRVRQSGRYSLVALPADRRALGATLKICGLQRSDKIHVDKICTQILCPAFSDLGALWMPEARRRGRGPHGDLLPPFPPEGIPRGRSLCDRCTGLRPPAGEIECDIPVVLPPLPLAAECPDGPDEIADPSAPGSFPVASTAYHFVDAIDIGADANVDVWATVRYPGASAGPDAPISSGTQKFPLVVYLHGNHGIWDTGTSHRCGPPGGDPPVPNHEGYDYVLDALASHGFIAVSINANDLNCLTDRIPERGRLILEHLRRWRDWGDPGVPDADFDGRFSGRVDIDRIGLAGHSRGGEAVVAAYLDNQADGLGFGIEAIHSLAPVDFHGHVLDDVPLWVLLPGADGDVSNLAGARIYDRAAPRTDPTKMRKMQSHVYGANHNWFNEVWYQDEGVGSDRLTAAQQRTIERVLALAFFRWHLQDQGVVRGLFTGAARTAALAGLEIYGSFQHPSHRNVDDFEDAPPDPLANSLGGANANQSLAPFGEYFFGQGGGAYNSTFYHETNGLVAGWDAADDRFTLDLPAAHRNVAAYGYLSFRIAQVVDAINPVGQHQDLDVGLEDASGNRLFVRVGEYDTIPPPYARPWARKTMLHTVRIPLPCFDCDRLVGLDASAVRRILFRFDRKAQGIVGIDSIQFSD